MERLRNEDPSQVDAGIVIIRNSATGGTIVVGGYSGTLDLPVEDVAEEARNQTVNIFKSKENNYEVIK